MATLNCVRELGVNIEVIDGKLFVQSPGYNNFNKDINILDAKNSGTTARLLSGLFCGLNLKSTIIGDKSLSKRPMERIIEPLKLMGANIESTDGHLPLVIYPAGKLKGIDYELKIPSAQVKSCILIAGFLADGITTVNETKRTREHTERIFKYIGAEITKNAKGISIQSSNVYSRNFDIPGDISSATFIIACALLHNDCEVKIQDVLLSEDRRTYIDLLIKMGAKIQIENIIDMDFEIKGDIIVKSSNLNGIEIDEELIPSIIDEIPAMAVLAVFSKGQTVFRNVNELMFKESNRIDSIVKNLCKCGINCSYDNGDLIIEGNKDFLNSDVYIESFMDHRIAMAFAIMACRNNGKTIIDNWECTYISIPDSEKYFKEFLSLTML